MPDQQVLIKPRPWLTGWRPVAVDGALVACLLALSAPLIITGTLAARALQVAVALATTLPLVVRRRWPLTVFAAVALAAFGQWLGRITLRPHDLAVLVALYTVAAYHTRRWAVAALGVCVFGAVLEWWQVAPRTDYNPAGLLAPLVVVTATWVLGSTLRTRRAYLVELEERAVRLERERDAQARAAVAEERARIAREMHDMVAHRVGVIVAQADGATYVFDTAPDQARAALKVIADSGRAALTEMRRLLGVLRDDQEQAIAPQPGIADIDRLVSDLRTSGLPVRYTVDGATSELEPGLALTVYRVVQESLTNTLKHAGPATPTAVVVRQRPDAVEVQVADEGPSAEASSTGSPVPVSNGHGLVGMAERVAMYGGTLHAAPRAGGGWRVDVVVPTRRCGRRWAPVSSPIGILLVDDQELLRMGFRMVLDAQPDMHVIGEADNGLAAVQQAHQLQPDVVLMDVRMPELDGVEATRRISAASPATRVLILTTDRRKRTLMADPAVAWSPYWPCLLVEAELGRAAGPGWPKAITQ